ncbi:MAG TPA: hypothetical protein VMT36_00705 [Candidatus Saccharimonadia bacterium]|nr:hypothetical protein [Candidatus Saccharimonadia bacterium]
MTTPLTTRRPGVVSIVMIVSSIGLSVALSLALDWFVFSTPNAAMGAPALALPFNATVILMSVVGAVVEWRRPGHVIGRLLMLSGPLYATLFIGWTVADYSFAPLIDPAAFAALSWATAILSYPGVALFAGWLPLLFPTGTLPGPRWRLPAVALVVVSTISLAAFAFRPGTYGPGRAVNPLGIEGWPSALQPLADALPFEMATLLILAMAALATRYRRGDRVSRLQIRWLLAAMAITIAGFAGVLIELAVRTDDGPNISAFVAYAGILAMPIAIGIAVTRYRLYEIDRIISRTLSYAVVTVTLAVVFVGVVLGLQAILAPFTRDDTVAVAASTLVVAALFQPLRRRIQRVVDRRFDRARYDADLIVSAFATRLRGQVDLDGLSTDLAGVVGHAVAPTSFSLWVSANENTR